MSLAPDNCGMAESRYLPPFPSTSPDPESCESFEEWIRDLTKKGTGCTQRQVAEVAGVSPQAVTKWLKGGSVEVGNLARLAEWSGYSFQSLSRLVTENKLRLMPTRVAESKALYRTAEEFGDLWAKLTDEHRHQMLGMGKALLLKQGRKRPPGK